MSAADIEVVEVGSSNSLLPNLTICVENEDDDSILPQIEYEQELTTEAEKTESVTNVDKRADVKPRLNFFPRKKIYENTSMGGAAELGLSFEEAKSRREKRAKRFQSPLVEEEEGMSVVSDELSAFAKNNQERILKFNETLPVDDDERIRGDTLHLTGVNSMSTEDIFGYFGKTNPRFIEWVNDSSCNVVWNDSSICGVALEKVALPFKPSNAEKKAENVSKGASKDISFDDDLDLLNDEEVMEIENTIQEETKDSGKQDEEQPINPIRKCREAFVKNKKESFLEVRYAKMADRKELFAAKKSKYYMEQGNPHYGGAKGLLSSTYRKRYQMKKAMKELRSLNVPTSRQYHDEFYENSMEAVSRKRVKTSTEDDTRHNEMEKEDDSLIKSTAKDLTCDSSSDDSDGYGTMVADQVSQRVKAVRSMSNEQRCGSLNITTSNNKVFSRLGKRRYDDRSDSRESILNRLPRDLRDRLGPPRIDQKSKSGFRSERVQRRDDRPRTSGGRRGKNNDNRSSPLNSNLKGNKSVMVQSDRKLTAYSPPPWEDSPDNDDEF